MIDLVFAHPYPDRSRANRRLLAAVRDLPGVQVRSLYERYPDFAIDVEAEQQALAAASVVVWQCPIYWYSVPALLKLWFDKVLAYGWAYGPGTRALAGKRCLWVATTGGGPEAYRPGGVHERPFSAFVAPVEETALFCGMRWQDPLVVHSARVAGEGELDDLAAGYRARLAALLAPDQGEADG